MYVYTNTHSMCACTCAMLSGVTELNCDDRIVQVYCYHHVVEMFSIPVYLSLVSLSAHSLPISLHHWNVLVHVQCIYTIYTCVHTCIYTCIHVRIVCIITILFT